jgi:hypothetical protein
MPWDEDEDRYLDYVARHESGFCGSDPPQLMSLDEYLFRMVIEPREETSAKALTHVRRRRSRRLLK